MAIESTTARPLSPSIARSDAFVWARWGVFIAVLLVSACERPPVSGASPGSASQKVAEAVEPLPESTAQHQTEASANSAATSPICRGATELLHTCAHEESCDDEMLLYLPSAARGQLQVLSQSPTFDRDAFAQLCQAACRARSSSGLKAQVESLACATQAGRASPSVSPATVASAKSAITIAVREGWLLSDQPIMLEELLKHMGKPTTRRNSRFDCDSAFATNESWDYEYPDAGFEVSGEQAVLRWARIGPHTAVSLPGLPSSGMPSAATLRGLTGHEVMDLDDRTVRVSVDIGVGLERAFDFIFDGARLARVQLWIAC